MAAVAEQHALAGPPCSLQVQLSHSWLKSMNVYQRNVNNGRCPRRHVLLQMQISQLQHAAIVPSSYGQSELVAVKAQHTMPCNCESHFVMFQGYKSPQESLMGSAQCPCC